MKALIKIKLIFLLFLPLSTLFAQQIKKVENKQLALVLTFIEERKNFNNDEIGVNIYRVRLPSDLVPHSEAHELYDRFYVSISKTGEAPLFKVYELSRFYNPENIEIKEVDKFHVSFQFDYGVHDARKKAAYSINGKT